jgi:CRP-like cAMP-binding protein
VSVELDQFGLLAELTNDERKALGEYLEPRELDPSSTLFRTGEEADAAYFVTLGAVGIRAEGQAVSELGPGEVLGALCLVSVGSRECDAVAATRTETLCLSREAYLRMRDDSPALALRLQEAILRTFSQLVRSHIVEPSPA